MLRLFLGLYLTLALGFAVSITTVEHVFSWLFSWPGEHYHRDAVRGPAYSLVEQLRPLSADAREQRLRELQPHYGLTLRLVDKAQLDLQPHEQALLASDQLVIRDELTRFIAPIDSTSQVLQIDLPEEPNIALLYSAGAYAMLSCLLGIVLFFWVRPHWRDLERLREAAQRFGENDFSARLYLSRRSNIRELAEHFNQMAARIEGLIANQRELTNGVSHELRTPIARLTFELDQLRRLATTQECGALIDDMHADLGDLEEMVSELLTYASLERGASEIQRQTIEAASWIDSVLGSVALEAEAAGVQLYLDACTVQDTRIEPRYMARAVINLLRNAIRYADTQVRVRLEWDDAGYVLQVEDDGPGVPFAAREKIFEPFSRLDASRDRRTGGFGLGLALVRRVSQWHGGQAGVFDAVGGGARFVLRWPHIDN